MRDLEELTITLRDIIREEVRSTHMPQYLGTRTAAKVAEVSQPTIRSWARRGELRAFWAGNDLRIRLVDLEAYLSRRNPENNVDVKALASAIMAGNG